MVSSWVNGAGSRRGHRQHNPGSEWHIRAHTAHTHTHTHTHKQPRRVRRHRTCHSHPRLRARKTPNTVETKPVLRYDVHTPTTVRSHRVKLLLFGTGLIVQVRQLGVFHLNVLHLRAPTTQHHHTCNVSSPALVMPSPSSSYGRHGAAASGCGSDCSCSDSVARVFVCLCAGNLR